MFIVCVSSLDSKALKEIFVAPMKQVVNQKRAQLIHLIIAALDYKQIRTKSAKCLNPRIVEVDGVSDLAPYNLTGGLMDSDFQIILSIPKSTILKIESLADDIHEQCRLEIAADMAQELKRNLRTQFIKNSFLENRNKELLMKVPIGVDDKINKSLCSIQEMIADNLEMIKSSTNFNGNEYEIL